MKKPGERHRYSKARVHELEHLLERLLRDFTFLNYDDWGDPDTCFYCHGKFDGKNFVHECTCLYYEIKDILTGISHESDSDNP